MPAPLDIQQADDMMIAIMDQRNAALNDNVKLMAQLRAAIRRAESAEARVAELEAKAQPELPLSNGADAEAKSG